MAQANTPFPYSYTPCGWEWPISEPEAQARGTGHADRRRSQPSLALRAQNPSLCAILSHEQDIEADPKRYDGPCAGFCYEVISVRNLAAMKMALDLGIAVPLKPTRTEAEWRTIRHAVRRTLERDHMNWVRSRERIATQR